MDNTIGLIVSGTLTAIIAAMFSVALILNRRRAKQQKNKDEVSEDSSKKVDSNQYYTVEMENVGLRKVTDNRHAVPTKLPGDIVVLDAGNIQTLALPTTGSTWSTDSNVSSDGVEIIMNGSRAMCDDARSVSTSMIGPSSVVGGETAIAGSGGPAQIPSVIGGRESGTSRRRRSSCDDRIIQAIQENQLSYINQPFVDDKLQHRVFSVQIVDNQIELPTRWQNPELTIQSDDGGSSADEDSKENLLNPSKLLYSLPSLSPMSSSSDSSSKDNADENRHVVRQISSKSTVNTDNSDEQSDDAISSEAIEF